MKYDKPTFVSKNFIFQLMSENKSENTLDLEIGCTKKNRYWSASQINRDGLVLFAKSLPLRVFVIFSTVKTDLDFTLGMILQIFVTKTTDSWTKYTLVFFSSQGVSTIYMTVEDIVSTNMYRPHLKDGGRYSFHRCLSVHILGGGYPSQGRYPPSQGRYPPPR